ncbi:MAG TPA: hypothetical protein VKA83_25835 [Methylomirabilota bacterium]|nr:hypothetical protein [Methylomirabilota bacterium]
MSGHEGAHRFEFRYLDAYARPDSAWEAFDPLTEYDVEDHAEVETVLALKVGERFIGGGGAAQGYEIRRVEESGT